MPARQRKSVGYVRANTRVPEDLLKRVDAAAEREGLSRSMFIVRVLRESVEPARRGVA
jgi:metal-responsive CopG/Arc/MetJ family transcriptional regulator